jgi:hypothetical protein
MSDGQELREQCAKRLLASMEHASHLTAFVGLDGFVDEIIHLVDVRQDANNYERTSARASRRQRAKARISKPSHNA